MRRPPGPGAAGGARGDGAHEWNRTIDLLLTKEVLYRLSYVSNNEQASNGAGDGNRTRTSSLEGYSSTIELLPQEIAWYCIHSDGKAGWTHCPSRSNDGGGRWIRTTEGVSQQIYSLPPLAAWVSLQ